MSSNYSGGSYLTETGRHLIGDILAVASNLGFKVPDNNSYSYQAPWEYGTNTGFYMEDGTEFMQIKFYKNGNAHIKLNQEFMRKFNIEAGRLTGWVKSPTEAAEEMGISVEEAQKCFKSNTRLLESNIFLLTKTIKRG
jgi:hypothetical protein